LVSAVAPKIIASLASLAVIIGGAALIALATRITNTLNGLYRGLPGRVYVRHGSFLR
jgi:hypothetical protein